MSRRKGGTPLWLSLLLLALAFYGTWEVVTNPEVHTWIDQRCGWACQ